MILGKDRATQFGLSSCCCWSSSAGMLWEPRRTTVALLSRKADLCGMVTVAWGDGL